MPKKSKPLMFRDGYPDITDPTTRKAYEAGEASQPDRMQQMHKDVDDYLTGLVQDGSMPASIAASISTASEFMLPGSENQAVPGPPIGKGGKMAEKLHRKKLMKKAAEKKAPPKEAPALDYGKMKAERAAERKAADEAAPALDYGKMDAARKKARKKAEDEAEELDYSKF